MKQTLKKLSLFAVALPFLVLGSSAQAAMTGAQIKSAISGKSFRYSGASSGTMSYSSSGTKSYTYTYKGQVKRGSGPWWISGNKICSKNPRKGTKGKAVVRCNSLTSIGGGKIKTSNGYTLTPR